LVLVADHRRTNLVLGRPITEDQNPRRNNQISLALFHGSQISSPLQSAAIHCGAARDLGINVETSNFPQHVHVFVEASSNVAAVEIYNINNNDERGSSNRASHSRNDFSW
jgi:hypothetical protein